MVSGSAYFLPLTKENAETISKFTNVTEVSPIYAREGEFAPHIFPYNPDLDGMKIISDLSGFP